MNMPQISSKQKEQIISSDHQYQCPQIFIHEVQSLSSLNDLKNQQSSLNLQRNIKQPVQQEQSHQNSTSLKEISKNTQDQIKQPQSDQNTFNIFIHEVKSIQSLEQSNIDIEQQSFNQPQNNSQKKVSNQSQSEKDYLSRSDNLNYIQNNKLSSNVSENKQKDKNKKRNFIVKKIKEKDKDEIVFHKRSTLPNSNDSKDLLKKVSAQRFHKVRNQVSIKRQSSKKTSNFYQISQENKENSVLRSNCESRNILRKPSKRLSQVVHRKNKQDCLYQIEINTPILVMSKILQDRYYNKKLQLQVKKQSNKNSGSCLITEKQQLNEKEEQRNQNKQNSELNKANQVRKVIKRSPYGFIEIELKNRNNSAKITNLRIIKPKEINLLRRISKVNAQKKFANQRLHEQSNEKV